jgi:hypothetical protein
LRCGNSGAHQRKLRIQRCVDSFPFQQMALCPVLDRHRPTVDDVQSLHKPAHCEKSATEPEVKSVRSDISKNLQEIEAGSHLACTIAGQQFNQWSVEPVNFETFLRTGIGLCSNGSVKNREGYRESSSSGRPETMPHPSFGNRDRQIGPSV